jgi:hypothetical protein
MSFTVRSALLRFAFNDAPVPLYDPPEHGAIVHLDLARERIEARRALDDDVVGDHAGGLGPEPDPARALTGGLLPHQVLRLTLPHARAEAVEAWLLGVLVPLAETIRAGVRWAGAVDPHDDEAPSLVAGFDAAADQALTRLAQAQADAWRQGLDPRGTVALPWRAFTWCHAYRRPGSDAAGGDPFGAFDLGGYRYVLAPRAGGIRQWWPGQGASLARLLAGTTPVWSVRRPDRNRDLAVLVWEHPELAMDAQSIADGLTPAPDAAALAHPEPVG